MMNEADSESDSNTVCLLDDEEIISGTKNTAIIIDSDSDDDGGGKMMPVPQYDDVTIVDPALIECAHTTTASVHDNDADVQIIGDKNAMRLPHMRQHCVEHKFVQSKIGSIHTQTNTCDGNKANEKYCDLCYCFVCDVPVSECEHWSSNGNDTEKNHCNASDQGFNSDYWKILRASRKRAESSSSATPFVTPSTPERPHTQRPNMEHIFDDLIRLSGIEFDEPGPFNPDSRQASQDPTLTKCRICGWYSKFEHKNYTVFEMVNKSIGSGRRKRNVKVKKIKKHPVGTMDWCHACGRVAHKRDFGKSQSKPYKAQLGDVSLGVRRMSFRIKAHDPRKITPFSKYWDKYESKSSQWIHNEGDLQDDFFHHRIGKHPELSILRASIPVQAEEDKIPEKALISRGHWDHCSSNAANETEALLLDNRSDIEILEGLFLGHYNNPFAKTIEAKWDNKLKKGTLTVSLFLRSSCLNTPLRNNNIVTLMGLWYNVFPFKLSGLTNGRLIDNIDGTNELIDIEERYNEEAKVVSTAHSFKCSTGTGGGVSENDISLHGMLRRYYKEALVDDCRDSIVRQGHRYTRTRDFVAIDRNMNFTNIPPGAATYLNAEDYSLMTLDKNRTSLISPITKHLSSLSGLLGQLENLGHSVVDQVDGLNVELFDFQSQAVSWALERERFPGGIQSCICAPLPSPKIFDCGRFIPTEIYYSPVLGQFKTQKPACVRGGIIAAEMGLGKTIISLALILQNPPPLVPESGSLVKPESSFDAETDSCAPTSESESVSGLAKSELSSNTNPNTCGLSLESTSASESLIKPESSSNINPSVYAPPLESTSASGSLIKPESSSNTKPSTCLPLLKTASGPGKNSNTNPNSCEPLLESTSKKGSKEIMQKSGSIFSRGTLVVCNVSLVGQWIDEAKSKLKRPGLVYSYHGSKRTRDASILAKNAIVVTTYATLQSDKYYHKRNCDELDYCPPCEQIKWWRIICDESHTLKNLNSNTTRAITSLNADHKWCVTGTPFGTSVNDLIGQLTFVGLEHLAAMFRVFQAEMPSHFRAGKRTRNLRYPNCSAARFLFTMRNIMIRHSINQQGRISNTDIMSLPPKEERVIEIQFTENERREYEQIENDARTYYLQRKGNIRGLYLKIYSALMPLRIACSGGIAENKDDEDDLKSHTNNPPKKKEDFPFTSKFSRLLQELEKIRTLEPESKSLVFSQFTSTLRWMKQELPKHGFQFRTLSGDMSMPQRTKALREFQSDPLTTIFLLSTRSGAVGINLTQANRIFLMEPNPNPALEAQAIGRVYRLGQRKPVKVIRMYMDKSFETRLIGVLKKKYSTSHSKGNSITKSNEDGGNSSTSDTDMPSLDMLEPEPELVASSCTQVVGHIQVDKNNLVEEEFDTLFGIST